MLRLKQAILFLLLAVVVGNTFYVGGLGTQASVLTPAATPVRPITAKLPITAAPLPAAPATAVSPAAPSLPTSSPSPAITIAPPVRLVIPKLGVDAWVESVGQDKNGAMGIPSKVEQVAWYRLGAAPGEIGNAVIAGHLDRADGSPAVFWEIGQLQAGDAVIVYDAANVAYHFQVTGNQRYEYSAAPVEDIFGFALRSQLNLITCAGTWDSTGRNYSSRLVVYTSLVKTVRPQ